MARLGTASTSTCTTKRGSLDEAEAALRAAAERDAGDHFRFVLSPGRRIAEGGITLRVNVIAFLGATEFRPFNVDLVAGAAHRCRVAALFVHGRAMSDDPAWRAGYARVAKDVVGLGEKGFDSAVQTARRFSEPVLSGTARGRWSPDQQAWIQR